MNRYVLALDLGASSGRAMLAAYDGEKIRLREVHRFSNDPVAKDGRLYWNVPQLMREIEQGMQAAYEIAPYESIAIDTWGVDYGLLKADGTLLELPRHYRDSRTSGILKKAEESITAADLYARTGTQVMEINTLFQLICDQESGRLDDCEVMLPMPDLFAYLLTGRPAHGTRNSCRFSTFPTGFCRKLWKAVQKKAHFPRRCSSGWDFRRFVLRQSADTTPSVRHLRHRLRQSGISF